MHHAVLLLIRGVSSDVVFAPDESNQEEYMPPYKYVLDEIQNIMFLALMEKALMGGKGGRRQNKSLFSYDKILCHISCLLCQGAKHILGAFFLNTHLF